MKIETVDQNLNAGKSWKIRMASPVAFMALSLIMAAVMLNHSVPKVPARPQGFIPRAGYYLRNTMWLADARTLAAKVRYLLEPESSYSDVATGAVSRLPDGGVPHPRALVLTPPDTATKRFPASVAPGQSESGEPS